MDAAKCCGTYFVHDYLFRYDPASEQWTRLADMPFGSSHMECQIVVIDGRILVLGGCGDRDQLLDRVQEYDPAHNRWRQLKLLPVARKGGIAWQDDGVLYLNGGQMSGNSSERRVVSETVGARIKRGSWLDFLGE